MKAFERLLSHFLSKNFVKVTVLLKKLLNNWFHEIFLSESKFFIFPHCFFSMNKISWNWNSMILVREFVSENIYLCLGKECWLRLLMVGNWLIDMLLWLLNNVTRSCVERDALISSLKLNALFCLWGRFKSLVPGWLQPLNLCLIFLSMNCLSSRS